MKFILETHFHADFVSGHYDLAQKTGATIVFGPTAKVNDSKVHIATDNEEIKVGKLTVKVLHTPGHTIESTCYLLFDEEGKQYAVFTGDTLFIGDVGRPDLAVKSNLTQEDLAGMLYDSLRNKLMVLNDNITVYPAHGAGSACGKNMSKETFDTLGHQKEVNYALQNISKADFIKELTTGILPAPNYFAKNAMMNKTGYDNYDDVITRGTQPLTPEQVEQEIANGTLVIDTRKKDFFAKGFIPNSIFIGIDGGFAPWVGTVVEDINQPIVIVADKGREQEVVMRLSRVGYDNVKGFLQGGFEAWKSAGKQVEIINQISAEQTCKLVESNSNINLLDVRKPGEFDAEHVEKAQHFALDFILKDVNTLDKNKQYHVYCQGGYRSLIAITIMLRNGYTNLIDVDGGFGALAKTSIPKIAFVCPSTLK